MTFPDNAANALTIFRILLIPIIVMLFYTNCSLGQILAGVLFLIACLTDYFDGLIARQADQVTALGRFLDPVADKLLIAASLIMLTGFNHIQGLTLIPAVTIICREIMVSGLREHLGSIQVSVPVTNLAKWKTVFQMFGIGFLIVGDNFQPVPLNFAGQIGLWLAAALTIFTGYSYLREGIKHMRPTIHKKR